LQLTTGLDRETQGDKQPEIIVGKAVISAPLSLTLFCYFGGHHAVLQRVPHGSMQLHVFMF
jgi:hypothetical protein